MQIFKARLFNKRHQVVKDVKEGPQAVAFSRLEIFDKKGTLRIIRVRHKAKVICPPNLAELKQTIRGEEVLVRIKAVEIKKRIVCIEIEPNKVFR